MWTIILTLVTAAHAGETVRESGEGHTVIEHDDGSHTHVDTDVDGHTVSHHEAGAERQTVEHVGPGDAGTHRELVEHYRRDR